MPELFEVGDCLGHVDLVGCVLFIDTDGGRETNKWRRECSTAAPISRVRGPWCGGARGPVLFSGPLPRRRRGPVGYRRKKHVSQRGRRVVAPLTNPRGSQSERRVYNAGSTKRTSVVYHGSSRSTSGEREFPLTPGCRGTSGLSIGRCACKHVVRPARLRPSRSHIMKPLVPSLTTTHP